MNAELRDRLDAATERAGFGPSDPAAAIAAGTRIRRRRTAVAGIGTAAVLAVAAGTGAALLRGPVEEPSPEFGDTGDRAPVVAPGGPRDGYPDLVVSAQGRRSVFITGFGWPIAGQQPVSTPDGEVAFPPIGRLDAESMCLPMLRQAAPSVPGGAWHHSGAWIDDFPSRAGLVSTFGAEHGGRSYQASCTLPGDFTPDVRPDLDEVPAPGDSAAILDQCGYLGHVDVGAWQVAATSAADGTLAAALVAPDGTFARCVLSEAEGQRLVQVSALDTDGAYFYRASGGTLTLVGRAEPDVARLTVEAGGARHDVAVEDGYYAAVIPGAGEPGALTAYDDEGSDITSDAMVLPALCFTTIETGDDGC